VFATLTVLGCMCSLAWSVVSSASGARQTAPLFFVLCGLVQAELARRGGGRSSDTPVVSASAVWIIGAALTLPPAGVLAVAAVLHTHDVLRGGRTGPRLGRVAAGGAGAALAWLTASAGGVLAAVVAGLLYLAVTDGPALLRRPPGHRSVDAFARAALGVLLGLATAFSPFAVFFVLLPVAQLQRSAHGRAVRYAAAHDAKTRLWNHAAWQTLTSEALARPRARARSAVLMVDLDHFKRLNDTYGHHAGDDVLTGVADVLTATTRRTDIVARFGGEEFSILLRGVSEQEACQVAERIRNRIAALAVPTTDLDGRPIVIGDVTASIGVAASDHAATSVDTLLVKADRWLYQAKERGRNRVCGPVLAAA
jgi:diguanylate cyclase (GGDEF)-like protein